MFLVWGYLDRPGIREPAETVVDVLAFAVPMAFAAGLLGLRTRCEGQAGVLGEVGIVLGLIGTTWGGAQGLLHLASEPAAAVVSHWLRAYTPLLGWDTTLFAGLVLVGIAAARERSLRGLGTLVLATGASGLVYYFTDFGAAFGARSVHVGFGLLFATGWLALGIGLRKGEADGHKHEERQGRNCSG